MEANELRVTDLMDGDWVHVISAEPNTYIRPFYQIITVEKMMMIRNRRMVVEPIPLTPEILEKNGFDVVRGNRIMGLQVSDRCTLRIGEGMKEMRVEMQNWGETEERKWFVEIRNLGSIILQLYIGYTHELQHALRLCKIKKEIVL